ncbi:MAG TPA: DNA recombination protein RmuC [Candidatus Saccharimonadales bacterium]|nr:DNA recombination protein RmuC [Candidatus Saccharimonadales bacterium]
MIIGVIVGSVAIGVLLIAAAFYFLGQRFVLQLTNLNSQQRKGNKEEIESGIKDIIQNHEKLLGEITRNLRKDLEQSQKGVVDLRTQNAAIREQLENTAKITEGLQVSTEGLRNLLANNRLRGEWGEQVAEDLLMAAGFVEKVNYLKQSTTTEGRPDFTILLPDGYKLNVDAKFPFDDLITYQEAKTPAEKRKALAAFNTAVRNKVREVSSKDYIDPENQTLDFVLMFIPNEMIFSFVYEKLPDINNYANERKVVLAGPFGFTAVLRMVLQAHKNFHHEKSLVQILGLISKFQEEYAKFGESMEKLGRQLDTAQKTFLEVEGTRSRQLTRVVEQISSRSQNSLSDTKKTKQLKIEN